MAWRIAIVAGLAAAVLAGLLVTDRPDTAPDAPASAPFVDLPLAPATAAPQARRATPPPRAERDREFRTADAAGPVGDFAIAPIATRWDATCDAHPELRFDDLRQAALDTGLDAGARFPERGHVVDASYRYDLDGDRVQLTAEWNYDAPARYELRVLRFDGDSTSSPRPLAIEGSARTVGADELAAALRGLDERLRARGARVDGRAVVLANYLPAADEPPDLGADHAFVVEAHDGRIVRYHAQGVACHARDGVATCSCPPADEHAHE